MVAAVADGQQSKYFRLDTEADDAVVPSALGMPMGFRGRGMAKRPLPYDGWAERKPVLPAGRAFSRKLGSQLAGEAPTGKPVANAVGQPAPVAMAQSAR